MLELVQRLSRPDPTGPGRSRSGSYSRARRDIGVGEHRFDFHECGRVYLDAAASVDWRSCTVGGVLMSYRLRRGMGTFGTAPVFPVPENCGFDSACIPRNEVAS